MGEEHTHTGLVVGDRYHLLRLLGEGGMATVFKAYDRQADRFVALKILHRGVRGDREALERFRREARATAAIQHPNVAIVFDFGTEAGRPFLVMEYVRGQPISRVLSVESTFAPGRAARIAELALRGLAAAHDAGVVHRDLKPSNILLTAAPNEPEVPKLCDFGAAAWSDLQRQLSEDDRRLTPTMTMFGTPAYAAPERFAGPSVAPDPRSDIYSMGVVLFEMISGLRPFDGLDLPSLARQILSSEPPDLTALCREVPPALAALVGRALAKDPSRRWQSAADMARALAPFAVRPEAEEDLESDSLTADLLRVRERARGQGRQEIDALLRERVLRSRAPSVGHDGEAALSPSDTFSELQTSPLPDATRRAVSTAVVRALKQWTESSFAPSQRSLLQGELDEIDCAGQWVACRPVERLIGELDARLGRGDLQLVPQVGRALADAGLVAWGAPQTPGAVVGRIPHAASTLLRGVEVKVASVSEGGAQLEMMERGTPSLTLCIAGLGFLERTLQRFGAREVEVNLTSCRALGDARCCIDATYLPSSSVRGP